MNATATLERKRLPLGRCAAAAGPGRRSVALVAPRDVPSLVIWGEHDAFIPAAYAYRQRDV